MIKKLMTLAVATSFLALAAPQYSSLAQTAPGGPEETFDERFKRECAEDAANGGFKDGIRYTNWANTESRQASEWRELERNARASEKTAREPWIKDMWKSDAERYAKNAKELEEQARRDLDRAKAGFAKFRQNEPCKNVVAFFGEFIDSTIADGELRADPEFWNPTEKPAERKAEAPPPEQPAEEPKPVEKKTKKAEKKTEKKAEKKTEKKSVKKAEKKTKKASKVARNRQPAEQQYVSDNSQTAAILGNMLIQNLVGGAMQYGLAKQRMRHHRHNDGDFGHEPRPRRKHHKREMPTGDTTFTGYTFDQGF